MRNRTRGLLKHDLLWGVGLGAAAVASTQILTWVGLGLTHWTWISINVLVVVFAVLGGRSLRRRLAAAPSLAQAALLIGLMILVSKVIYQAYMFVYINVVDPTWVDMVAEVSDAQLRAAGTSEERIASNIADFRNQWRTGYIFSLGIVRYELAHLILGFGTITVSAVRPWRRSSRQASAAAPGDAPNR